MGYTASSPSRSAARNSTATIGILINNIGTEYISEIVDGISNILDVASYDITIFNPYRMQRTPDEYVLEVTQRPIDGLIIAAANILRDTQYLDQLCQQRLPIVFVDQRVPNSSVPYVTATNWQGAFDAMRYLIQLGHRRIGHIAGPMEQSPSSERLAGYRDALTQNGIAYDETLVQYGDFTHPSGYACAQELLALNQPPTALFASNDPMAFGAMAAIHQSGRRIPDDLSVIGFDDIASCAHSQPPLTTVRQPLREMGRVGAQIILDMLRGQPALPRVVLRTSLNLRESCAPLRQQ